MLPQPLHPAVVHFPLVLALILPLVIGVTLWVLRGKSIPWRTWSIPLVLSAALAASAFVAVRTGEADEDRVESVVPKGVLHTHEEAAERFLVLTGVLLLVATAGLARGTLGAAARLLTVAGSVVVAAAAVQVGAAGGEMVYGHNAASVYQDSASQNAPLPAGDED